MAYRSLLICMILVPILKEISALKCWRCSSSLKFCGDILQYNNLTENQLDWYLVPCGSVRKKTNYKGDKMISKCNMRIELADERLVYTRKCVEESEKANPNSCLTDESFMDNDNPTKQLLSCETCTEDGCNIKINNYFTTEIESPTVVNFGLTCLIIDLKSITWCLLVIRMCSRLV